MNLNEINIPPINAYHTTRIAVVGAGHAGVEAALAAARLGMDTVLFTLSLDAIANMPCNPSIGGTGKGHLVYEIDALGGEMGRAADATTLQSRTLNTGKGAAVQSRRVQSDRRAYHAYMKQVLEMQERLRVVQAEVVDLLTETDKDGVRITGLVTSLGEIWSCEALILCTGTYLDSRIFVGDVNYSSGPDGFLPARGLSDALSRLGVRLLRFKTGTPARVRRSSINLDALEIQAGESPTVPYAESTPDGALDASEQLPCHVVYTNKTTHDIILQNIKRSAMYSGAIHGTGPRYCPSIEDKLTRFSDKERHQLFVEPVGKSTEEMYIQGFSTSLPTDVQLDMIRSLDGFEAAEIMRYAYAIEYDCADPTQLDASLAFKSVKGLYGAGQFNGTSGYEEAAAQGLVAGINAALCLRGEEPMILGRSDGYIGTLIDDLVTKGTNEPYRMMTSRSEYRLLLRQDNADLRLTPIGRRVGLVSDGQYTRFEAKKAAIEHECDRLRSTHLSPARVNPLLEQYGEVPVNSGISLADLLRRPALTYEMLSPLDEHRPALSRRVRLTVEVTIKYDGYIKREIAEVERHRKLEERRLPEDIDYLTLKGLRIEAAQKLQAMRPLTVGQASRISGVNPADVSVLLIYLGLK
ncbi:MAG: tRNA uridine-5-carboxymethylaminomethyl(34) synthesis enzyme MnmG [Clostridia bacterium]|nr:tRNA uridine-5-carboxymethylaminomethyl(34) synthesis enzyme MnmG [Clostridia bacterium]